MECKCHRPWSGSVEGLEMELDVTWDKMAAKANAEERHMVVVASQYEEVPRKSIPSTDAA